MLIKKPERIRPSEITTPEAYFGRRRFMRDATGAMIVATVPGLAWHSPASAATKLDFVKNTDYKVEREISDRKHVTTYNNFYEFGTAKDDPAENAKDFQPLPWSVELLIRSRWRDMVRVSDAERVRT